MKSTKSSAYILTVLFCVTIIVTAPGLQGAESEDKSDFIGLLRIYMLQYEADIPDLDGNPFRHMYIDFALDSGVIIPDNGSFDISTVWDAGQFPEFDLSPDKIMTVATLVNSEIYGTGYSDPPDGNPFTIYPFDAAAAATIDRKWGNVVSDDYSHTVLLDKATART